MTGDELFGEPLPPEVDDVDRLPFDEVTVKGYREGAGGEVYWYWQVPGYRASVVGYRDEAVARRKGAEFLRAERQKRAMRQG